MNLIDELQSLDMENPGGWSNGVKIIALVFLIALIVGAGFFLLIKEKRENLEGRVKEEKTLRDTYTYKYKKAAQLEAYRKQLADMEIILQSMLKQLPSKNEMPDLIVDISQTALASGIDNELFEPGPEKIQNFYAEKPITLRMIGSYHEFGRFVSGVASLPRVVILTMNDISLKPVGDATAGGKLLLEGTAKTYRYLDEDEQLAVEEAQRKATAGGKK
ncbi:type 4a pilus biogenesis protein PilO [Marinicella sp. W31]|uniref:type 4a pilus biogenesis protein PilO n=1 Tax=Marinicella sp. W31 TaxID=3023713 RepID=UPI0037573C02